jgi:hypothetical protein
LRGKRVRRVDAPSRKFIDGGRTKNSLGAISKIRREAAPKVAETLGAPEHPCSTSDSQPSDRKADRKTN